MYQQFIKQLVALLTLSSFVMAQSMGVSMGSSGQTLPQLPSKFMATTINATNWPGLFSAPAMRTVKPSGGDYTSVQAAITDMVNVAANCDAIITVDAGYTSDTLGSGQTLTDGYTCPVGHAPWVRSSDWQLLAPQGTRVACSNAHMFTVSKTAGNDFPILFQDGKNGTAARGFIVTGMELNIQSSVINYGIAVGNSDNPGTTYADHIIIDRSYIHYSGGTGGEIANMVSLQGSWNAIVDSCIDGVHTKSVSLSESHGIWVNSGPGPFKIVNNYIGDVPTENIFYGGADPLVANALSRDSEIRRNTLFSDWTLLATGYCKKNIFELKNAQRVLFDGNTLQYSWNVACGGGGQSGNCMTLTPVNQGGLQPWANVADVTVSNNDMQDCGGYYVTINGRSVQNPGSYAPTQRLGFFNNVFRGLNQTTFNTGLGGSTTGGFGYDAGGSASGIVGQNGAAPFNTTWLHNGIYGSATNGNYWMFLNALGTCTFQNRVGLTYKANIYVGDGEINGSCQVTLDNFFTNYGNFFPGSSLTGNVMVGVTAWAAPSSAIQSNNFFPAGTASAPPTNLFTNYASCVGTAPALPGAISNCALLGTDTACSGASCHNNPQCDSLDCGPDIAKIQAAQIEPNDSVKWGPRSLN